MPRLLPLLAFLACAFHAAASAPDPAPKDGGPSSVQQSPPPIPAPAGTAPVSPPPAAAAAIPAAANSPESPKPASPASPAEAAESPPAAPKAYSAVQKFDHAVAAYEAGDYTSAKSDFLALVEDGHLSAPLAHNLGNIEYKNGHDGLASLWYRRALAMRPFSIETLQNLRFLRHRTGFQTWDTYGLSISHFSLASAMNTTLLIGWCLVILLVWLFWSPPRRGLRWPLIALLVLLIPTGALSGVLWWLIAKDTHPLPRRYVLTGAASAAYAAPAEAASQLISLPPGSEVMPLETRGNWFYCEIPSGSGPDLRGPDLRGWVRSSLLQPLWPYPAAPRG